MVEHEWTQVEYFTHISPLGITSISRCRKCGVIRADFVNDRIGVRYFYDDGKGDGAALRIEAAVYEPPPCWPHTKKGATVAEKTVDSTAAAPAPQDHAWEIVYPGGEEVICWCRRCGTLRRVISEPRNRSVTFKHLDGTYYHGNDLGCRAPVPTARGRLEQTYALLRGRWLREADFSPEWRALLDMLEGLNAVRHQMTAFERDEAQSSAPPQPFDPDA